MFFYKKQRRNVNINAIIYICICDIYVLAFTQNTLETIMPEASDRIKVLEGQRRPLYTLFYLLNFQYRWLRSKCAVLASTAHVPKL